MTGPSIILDPQKMFQTLQTLENHTRDFIVALYKFGDGLQNVAQLTYAIGFGELIKKAETDLNQLGFGAVAATNAVFTACKDVVNELVNQFASQGAKSDYSSPAIKDMHIKVNPAHRAAIYPQSMRDHFDQLQTVRLRAFERTFNYLASDISSTSEFWVGTSADRFRDNYGKKLYPQYHQLRQEAKKIIEHGFHWIDESVKFEASLGVQ